MMRLALVAGAICGVAGAALAEAVPAALQGRWAKAEDCARQGGLTLGPGTMSFSGDGGEQIVLTVDASEVHDGRARLTITSIAGGDAGPAGPKLGDSMLLERIGDTLRPLELVSGGKREDMTDEPPIGLCK